MKRLFLILITLATVTTMSAKVLPAIHVEGKNFVDESGNTIIFRGLCFSDPVKLISENKWGKEYFSEAASWNANIVRFPIHPQNINKYGWDKTFEAIDQGIEWAKQLGMYVIIDWHSIGNLKDEKYTNQMYNTTKEETFRFWRTVAQRYKDEPTVALYELFNEPTIGQKDLGKCTWEEWRAINEQLIDTIRAYDSNTICICAGFNWAYDLTEVRKKPIRRHNIAYVSHPYPMKREQPWEEQWEKDFGYVADTYPVICTEIGYCLESEKGAHIPVMSTDVYGDHITEYFEQKGISFTVWCFDPHWAPTLINDWNYTPSTQGRYFKKYLQSQKSDVNTKPEVLRDIPFAQAPTADGGMKDLKINIYKGQGHCESQPVVLFVHGGAWVSGDNNLEASGSEQIKALMELRDKGITIAAATYRFSNEAIFPAQIHDVKAAIRYLKANADKYGIDPDRIMTMGESAGAQLALLAAVSNGETYLEGNIGGYQDVDSKVIGCVDCYGMTDFLTLASDLYARKDLGRKDAQIYELVEDKNSSRSQLFGLTTEKCNLGTVTAKPKKFPEQYALVKQGSPIFHVTPDDPPILIINGQKDIRVPSAQAIKMYEALYNAGVEAELLLNDRAPHGNLGTEAASSIKSFVSRILLN